MASRMKDDEKNEKIIRGLLKLPGNKRCINCNSLGPQYVCTNFWTFICMNCSGVHREFTHRVKSVSMAKFTTQEVNALQEGGNERAREFYFKQWDPQRHSFPDSSNVDRLREFIRHAYVDRRYTGERVVDGPSRTKGEREDSYESRKSDAYRGGSRSPPYEEKYDRRSMDQPGPGRRNDDRNVQSGYEERQSPAYGRSPGRLDSATERHGNGDQVRSFEDRRVPDGPPRSEARSSGHQKELKIPSPPMVRPVREILGEDPPPLRVGEPPQTDLTKAVNGSLQTQRTASSNSLASVESIPAEVKRVDLGSLIDFDETPEPAVAAPEPAKDSQGSGGDWASFDSVQRNPAQVAPSNVTPLESALAGLSLSSAPPTSVDLFFPANAASQQPPVQQSLPPPVHLNQGQPSNQASLFAPPNTQPAVDDKTSGRRELPADLFSGSYPSVPYAGWQVGPRVPMGFAMQYPHQLATMPAFPPQPIRSTNPFDLSPQPTMPQAHSFPPMQGARPAMGDASFALAQGAGFGMSAPQWAAAPQRPFSHPSAAQVPLGGFPAQPAPTHQMPGTFPPLGYGQLGAPFGAPPSTDVHRGLPSGGGGNPFG